MKVCLLTETESGILRTTQKYTYINSDFPIYFDICNHVGGFANIFFCNVSGGLSELCSVAVISPRWTLRISGWRKRCFWQKVVLSEGHPPFSSFSSVLSVSGVWGAQPLVFVGRM